MEQLNKAEFLKKLARVEGVAVALDDMLLALQNSEFSWTKEGHRKLYAKYYPDDEAKCALSWMDEHYDNISAQVNAALILVEFLRELTDPLWRIAGDLIPEPTETEAVPHA